MQAAIIIVTYNSGKEIAACLDAALASGAEVIVVDNASSDGTVEEAGKRNICLIANPANRGFASAVNQGVRATSAPFLLLLNPDAVLLTGIEPLIEACLQPGIGLAGGKLVDESGRPQTGFMLRRLPAAWALACEVLLVNRLWPANPVNRRYRCLGMDDTKPGEAEQPAGALLMFRREVWEKAGGFDERFYPLWFEDVDFAKRARDLGYRAYYDPRVVAKHTGAHSITGISLECRQLYWYGNLLKYASKHFSVGAEKGLCAAVILGSIARMIAGFAHQRSLKPIAVYSRIVRLAGARLLRARRP
jgi:N-acetylglucosaminyl-diphospho-decaprenol L-rhamnosyltransferase